MKTILIAVLISLLVGVAYVSWHLWRLTPCGSFAKLSVVILFLLWMASTFVSLFFSERFSVPVATLLYEVSYTWLIFFLYLLIVYIVADVLTLCRLLPKTFLSDSGAGLFAVFGIVAAIMVAGNLHYRHKYREELTICTSKPLQKPLTIVFASDLMSGSPRLYTPSLFIKNISYNDCVMGDLDILNKIVQFPFAKVHCYRHFRKIINLFPRANR